ncbi:MAG: hypothetical protein ACR2FU_22935 [Streptosporangiaceae bacterium]
MAAIQPDEKPLAALAQADQEPDRAAAGRTRPARGAGEAARPPGRRGASSGTAPDDRRIRGPFEPANDLEAPIDDSLARPFYRGKLPPPPDEPLSRQPSAASPPAGNPPAEAPSPGPPAASRSGSPGRSNGKPMSQAARASMWSPSVAKMDQIKDLYLTAEAIGENALDRNFEMVSDRQRQLIREYFDDAPGSEPS